MFHKKLPCTGPFYKYYSIIVETATLLFVDTFSVYCCGVSLVSELVIVEHGLLQLHPGEQCRSLVLDIR